MNRFLPTLALLLAAGVASAAPQINRLSLRGLQIGETTVLTIQGSGLAPNPQIVLPFAVHQTLRPGATGNSVEVELELSADVIPGIYPLRIGTEQGLSNAVAVGVDDLPQIPLADSVESPPVAMHGNLTGSAIVQTKIAGRRGERLVVDVESRRLGEQLDPILRLYDPHGAQISYSQPLDKLAGDARLVVELPADGVYQIELHDRLYRGKGPGAYRLKIGNLSFADFAMPSGVPRGESSELTPFGGGLSGVSDVHQASQQPRDEHAAFRGAHFTGLQPRVIASELSEISETEESVESAAPPVAFSGRLASPGEEDAFRLKVSPGMKLRLNVHSRRVGSPLDGVLIVRNPDGRQLARGDDAADSLDPAVDFTVPGGLEEIVVAISDLAGRGGEDFVYRVEVTEQGTPDFSLTLEQENVEVPAGGRQVVRVLAQRRGYEGPIRLELLGLPAEFSGSEATIAAGTDVGLLLIAATGPPQFGHFQIVGRAEMQGGDAARSARRPDDALSRVQPWLAHEIPFAVIRPSPIAVAWGGSDAADPFSQAFYLGSAPKIPLKITRETDLQGPIRLLLVTDQIVPKKTVNQNNQEVQVDDPDRTLRLEGAAEFEPGAAAVEAGIFVPQDLPEREWQVVLVAELLSADKKQVLATAIESPRIIKPLRAVRLELSGEPAIEARAGQGATGRLNGKIIRGEGITGPVTVTLANLPQEYPAPVVEVPADQDEFELEVRFPAGAKPGEQKAELTGTIRLGEGTAEARSNRLPVTIKVVAGE